MFENKKIHMIGIGGISMSSIAQILLSFNTKITGYDIQESDITRSLIKQGIEVNYEENLDNVKNADIVVYTAAIPDDHKELVYAKEHNKEIYERSVFLGKLMQQYENVICISGTHGKSTTTGMVSEIFIKANLDPTIMIGAMLPIINGNSKTGSKKYFISESCEYVDSFLDFYPTSEVILNIDDDHLDYFKNIDNIINSFNKFTKLLPNNGFVVANNDDNNTLKAVKDVKNLITFGINNTSMYQAKNITYDNNYHPTFDLYINNEYKDKITLSVRGIHNVYDSLASIAISMQYIDDINIIKEALYDYSGVGRRFEYKGDYNGCLLYDDYAHHPSEIQTTVDAALNAGASKVIAIFQSHTFSRTYQHLKDFGKVLSKFDEVIIAPIYPARETNTFNIKEEDLVKEIKNNGNNNAIYIDSFDKIVDYLKNHIQKGNLVITVGAGPVNQVIDKLKS